MCVCAVAYIEAHTMESTEKTGARPSPSQGHTPQHSWCGRKTFASGINGMNQGHMHADCAADGMQKFSKLKNNFNASLHMSSMAWKHKQLPS